MVTGDNIDTAIAISKEAGIIDENVDRESGYTCMTGKQFREAVGGLVTQIDEKTNEKFDHVANQQIFDKITS